MSSLHIKNMVCARCIRAVTDILVEKGVHYNNIELGKVDLTEELSSDQLESLREALSNIGFELLDDNKSKIVEQIKNVIVNLVHSQNDDDANYKISNLIQDKVGMDYHYLSSLFSAVAGITIEKYVIQQKVERVKELITYDEKNISEIAYELGYSSVQHLSQQFKKVTGLTPSQFKQLNQNLRKPLDGI